MKEKCTLEDFQKYCGEITLTAAGLTEHAVAIENFQSGEGDFHLVFGIDCARCPEDFMAHLIAFLEQCDAEDLAQQIRDRHLPQDRTHS